MAHLPIWIRAETLAFAVILLINAIQGARTGAVHFFYAVLPKAATPVRFYLVTGACAVAGVALLAVTLWP